MKPIRVMLGGERTVTWNSADKNAAVNLSNGSRTAGKASAGATFTAVRATRGFDIASTVGRYFEIVVNATTSPNTDIVSGIGKTSATLSYPGDTGSDSLGYYHRTGQKLFNAAGSSYGGGVSPSGTHVVGVCMRNGKVFFAIDNTFQGSGNPVSEANPIASGLTGIWLPMVSIYQTADQVTGNFKRSDLTYAPPAGYLPWGG